MDALERHVPDCRDRDDGRVDTLSRGGIGGDDFERRGGCEIEEKFYIAAP